MIALRPNEELKVNYSPLERQAFSIISRAKAPLTFDEIVARMGYKSRRGSALHGNNTIGGAVRALARKIAENGESFEIIRTRRAGPLPVKVTLKKKGRGR